MYGSEACSLASIGHHPSRERRGWYRLAGGRRYLDVGISDVESIVSRSAALSAVERIDIYRQSYHLRLVDCLRGIAGRPGRPRRGTVRRFRGRLPQRSPFTQLYAQPVGRTLPRYLAENRMHGEETEPDAPSWLDFLIDLASFERVVAEVYDGPGLEDRQPLGIEDGTRSRVTQGRRPVDRRPLPAPTLDSISGASVREASPAGHNAARPSAFGLTPPFPRRVPALVQCPDIRLSRVQHDIIASLSPELYPHLIIDRSTHSN